jgi:serine/threonine protein kinase
LLIINIDNILLANEKNLNELKIADFGLSTKLDFHYPKTATSKCGTMLFMAPEILCNYTYTKSVDIWSCSIIMYMLYVGKHPFY